MMPTFAPISLDELVAAASLLTRVDRKYIVPRADLGELGLDLDPDTRILEINGVRSFLYESVYFDTPERTSYWMAARPRRRRFKVRTRTYLDSSECYLEVKTRGSRSNTVKERISYRAADRRVLTAEGLEYAESTLAATGITGVDAARLTPVLTTRYKRTTLYIPFSQSRATIDVDLEWQMDNGRTLKRPDMAIIETKSGSRASAVDRILWAHGRRPAAISKYATGLAALEPELASNKWSRILRDQFDRPISARV
jgi:hypothetical protein